MAIIKTLVAALAFFMSASAFTVQPLRSGIAKASSTRLQVGGPLQKLLNKDDYNQKIDNIMKQKKLTREQAEKEYDSYLDDPNSYALQKGEEYYKSLGYKSFMDGVIGEAEKEGKGDEVRQRIDEFKKQSQIKAYAVLTFFVSALVYYKITYDP